MKKIILFLVVISLALFASLIILNTSHNLFSNAIVKARPCGYDGLTCCSELDKNGTTIYTCPSSPDSARCYTYGDTRLQCKTLKDVCGTKIGSPCCEDMTCGSNTNLKCLKYPSQYSLEYYIYSYTNPWATRPPAGFMSPDRLSSLTNKSVGVCGENTILPTPKSLPSTCGGINEPCCPGNICDEVSPLNACFYRDPLSQKLCKPITPVNVNFALLYDTTLVINNNHDMSVNKNNKNNFGLFEIMFEVSSDISPANFQRYSSENLYISYEIFCNDNRSSISIGTFNDNFSYGTINGFTCTYGTNELAKPVHLSIFPSIISYGQQMIMDKIESTFRIYDADSIITSTPTSTPSPNSTIAPSPQLTSSPTPSPQPGGPCNPPCRTGFSCNTINKCVKK